MDAIHLLHFQHHHINSTILITKPQRTDFLTRNVTQRLLSGRRKCSFQFNSDTFLFSSSINHLESKFKISASYSSKNSPPKIKFPSIKPISSDALSTVLPLTGTGEQVLQELGGPSIWLRRTVLSLFGSMLLYNLNTFFTIIAAFYWAWCPMFSAARVNAFLRIQYPYAGIWSGRIINSFIHDDDNQDFVELVIGDETGFTIEMRVPLKTEKEKLIALGKIFHCGESVRMLTLSDKPSFSRFVVLREAFFPRYTFWIGEQTYLEHNVFEEMVSELAMLDKQYEQESDENYEGRMSNEESFREMESFEYDRYYKNREPQKYMHNLGLHPVDSAVFDSQAAGYSDGLLDNPNYFDKSVDFY